MGDGSGPPHRWTCSGFRSGREGTSCAGTAASTNGGRRDANIVQPADLYHCGLVLSLDNVTYAVEMGPVWNVSDADRGVLAEGPVGSRWLGRFRAFRYEMRCWPGGRIPDIAEAVDSPVRTTEDPARVAAVLDVLPEMPVLTWGRDELGAGEMWNSNSAVAWALARTGHDMDAIGPPPGGRAPGWTAGLVLAGRQA